MHPKVKVRFATSVCQPLKGSQPITCRSKNSAVSLHMKCARYDLTKHFSASTALRRLLQADTYSDTWKNASAVGFISWGTSHVQDCFAWRRRRGKIRSVILCACHYNAATRRLTEGIHGQTSCEHPYSETILIFSQKSLPE